MKIIDLLKPLMVIDYLLEHETEEYYLYDFAKKIGIKIREDGTHDPYDYFSHINQHEITKPKNGYAFCWATGKFISIDEIEKFIKKAKEMNATHMDIHFHADHGNYNLHAVQFRLATEKEIEKLKTINEKEESNALIEIDIQIKKLLHQKDKIVNGLK